MPRPRCSAALLAAITAVALAACAGHPRSRPRADAAPQAGPHEADGGHFGDRVLVEPMVIPGAWLHRDVEDVPGTTSRPFDGYGYGLRGALGNRNQSIGLCWQEFATDDEDGADLRIHCLGLDVDVRAPLDDGTGLFAVRAGAGVGGSYSELEGDDQLGFEGMAQLRIGIECMPDRRISFGGFFGGLVLGHPGETEVYGTFLGLTGTITF